MHGGGFKARLAVDICTHGFRSPCMVCCTSFSSHLMQRWITCPQHDGLRSGGEGEGECEAKAEAMHLRSSSLRRNLIH